jgi:hypothetical protein
VLEGIYLAADTDESFFIGTDQENGQGILRFKYYDDSDALKVNEMSFDREDNFRPYFYDPTATSPTYKKVAWLDELASVNPTLQTVTTQGRSSTDRLQYSSGGTLVNYALTSEIGTSLGIESVLAIGNIAKDNYLNFQAKTISVLNTGIRFLDISGDEMGNILFAENASTKAIGIRSNDLLAFTSTNGLTINVGNNAPQDNGRLTLYGDLHIATVGTGIILNDSVTPTNEYRITIESGLITATLI